MRSRRRCHSAVAAATSLVARLERDRHGGLRDPDLTDDVGDPDEPDVVDERRRRDDPTDAPPDHPQLLRRGADDDRSLRHPVEREGIDDLAPVEEDPLHRRVDDEEQIALAAEIRNGVPRLPIEHRPGRHRRAHHQKHPRPVVDGGSKAVEVEAPAGRASARAGRGSARRRRPAPCSAARRRPDR